MATRSRYPGVNSFKEGDHDIFCGRKKDTEELLRKIIINNTVVLHGDSGKGKSSLVQAGLLHELEKHNEDLVANDRLPYIPLVIKMDQVIRQKEEEEPNTLLLVKFVISMIRKNENAARILERSAIPYLTDHPDSLWYISKQFEKEGYSLLLILDQFEELQTYTTKQADALALALSEIFIFRMPQAIYQEFNKNINAPGNDNVANDQALQSDVLAFLEQQLSVRLLFVIREDKLGVMSLLNTHFPGILKNDYLLKPLTADGARMAISSPCHIDGEFSSPKFEIDPEATEELLTRLYSKDTPGYYDPIELQIICSNIERKLGDKTSVTKDDLPKVENAIKEFYDDVWAKARNSAGIAHTGLNRTKKKMIKELVVNGKRNMALKETLIEKQEGSAEKDADAEKVLQSLRAEGLVREIPGGKETVYYQLCHDRFIEAAAEDIQQAAEAKQLQKQRNVALIVLGIILLVIGISVAVIANRRAHTRSDEKTWILLKMLQRRNNPTLAYVAGKDWSDTRSWATTVREELAALDTGSNVFLKGIYPLGQEAIGLIVQNDSTLLLEGTDQLYRYNTSTGLFTSNNPGGNSLMFVSRVFGPAGDILIYSDDPNSKLIIKNQSGQLVDSFKNDALRNTTEPSDISISPDLRYVYIGGVIYDFNSGTPMGSIKTSYPVFEDDATKKVKSVEQVSSVTFFPNNILAAGYSDGSIRTYKITAGNKMLPEIDTLSIPDIEVDLEYTINSADFNNDGNKITSLNADRSGKYLYVNTQFNSVLIYDFQKSTKKGTSTTSERERATPTNNFAGEIKGHLSQIVTLTFSPDNQFVLTGSYDHYFIIWDASDPYDLQKVTDFRTPYAEKLVSTWFPDNKNIFTLSEDNKLYWWKMDRPAHLYMSDQLYHFSPFIYRLNLMGEEKYTMAKKPVTTKEQFKYLVNYLITIPDEDPFPADNMYDILLKEALPGINSMYHKLISMPDYEKEIPEENKWVMENLFVKMIDNLPWLPDVQKDILSAKHKMIRFKSIADSTLSSDKPAIGNNAMNVFFLRTANGYLEIKYDYPGAYTYIRYIQDSILPPVLPTLGQKDKELILVNLNYYLIKYHIYTGHYDSAISLADTGIAKYPSKKVYFMYRKIGAYLASGKISEAKELFGQTELEQKRRRSLLKIYLKQLTDRNIAPANVNQFIKEIGLLKEEENDEDDPG